MDRRAAPLAIPMFLAMNGAGHAVAPATPVQVAPAVAKSAAGSVFPAQCGKAGERCAIAYDEKRGCPREFVVTFPAGVKHAEPMRAWITLDASGAVREVVAFEPASCRPGATR